jgi:hypothetical protein
LSDADEHQWRDQGYAMLRGVFADPKPAADAIAQVFPPGDSKPIEDFGSGDKLCFPGPSAALNAISTDERLIALAQRLLGTRDILLIQSVTWAKYGVPDTGSASSNRDQRMHMDYGNNTWVHPPPWERPNVLAAIVYLSDSPTGGTAICPRNGPDDPLYRRPYRHAPGLGGIPFRCDKTAAEALMRDVDPEGARLREEAYAREVVTSPSAGDVLLYRHDVWHRGTPLAEGAVRYVVNLAWATRDAVESGGVMRWNDSWIKNMYGTFEPLIVEKFIGSLSPQQLVVLGFPHPGSAFWHDAEARENAMMRFGWAGFDIATYLALKF